MIHTIIDVSGDDKHEFERELNAALDKLGYEPKPSEDHTRWMRDLWQALGEREINPHKLVEDWREKQRKAMEHL